MTDSGRQGLTDKAGAALKPDSEKSYVEQASDMAKGAYDKVAGTAQPESEKSTGQKASDTLTGGGKDAEGEAKSTADSASKTASDGLESAKDKMGLK